ncbi:MAG TPA: type II toxin-antitoxin system HicA family toxin [Lamprocystis sp. (in: g-proteobacteria)]|nr:type II toxin-antitoxin system HicA family toxin [Lamprocystis sp. (in: g-proteobacteria)]
MNRKHRATLAALFVAPTPANIVFADLESMVLALNGAIIEGRGSRVAFVLLGQRIDLHRPHPGKEARRYQVEQLRGWLTQLEIMP